MVGKGPLAQLRAAVPRCCEWLDSTYPYQASLSLCSYSCVFQTLLVREHFGFALAHISGDLPGYMRQHQIKVPSLVVGAGNGQLVRPEFWVPPWIKPLFPLGSSMRAKAVPHPKPRWPDFLSRCNEDVQLREAVLSALHVGATASDVRELILVGAPDLFDGWSRRQPKKAGRA